VQFVTEADRGRTAMREAMAAAADRIDGKEAQESES
jgi:hypothetical protein